MKTITKKYRLLENDTRTVDGKTLYRVEAIKDFASIEKGDKGGYIESEENLSQEGDCWIYRETACVFGNAKVFEDAIVIGGTKDEKICNNTKIFGKTEVFGQGTISNSNIHGKAIVVNIVDINNEEITEDKFFLD